MNAVNVIMYVVFSVMEEAVYMLKRRPTQYSVSPLFST